MQNDKHVFGNCTAGLASWLIKHVDPGRRAWVGLMRWGKRSKRKTSSPSAVSQGKLLVIKEEKRWILRFHHPPLLHRSLTSCPLRHYWSLLLRLISVDFSRQGRFRSTLLFYTPSGNLALSLYSGTTVTASNGQVFVIAMTRSRAGGRDSGGERGRSSFNDH